MSKASGIIDGNDEGQGSQGTDTRSGHHLPNSLIALCHCRELSIIFFDLLGQTGLGKEQRRENILYIRCFSEHGVDFAS